MRDPRGALRIGTDRVVRDLTDSLPQDDFLLHPLAGRLVADKKLIPFEVVSPRRLESPRLPFVSYPTEWTDKQLFDAAVLTIDIAECLSKESQELKDASAWNVIFDGCRPMFCDHLSFQKIRTEQWWAFGQFVRHFVFPLAASRWRGIPSSETFRSHRDGLSSSRTRELLGLRRFATRQWPLMMNSKSKVLQGSRSRAPYHPRLLQFLRWQMEGLVPRQKSTGVWAAYQDTRTHYDDVAIEQKRSTVARWIERSKPQWVLDLGCNTGEFSLISAQLGAQVIAADFDAECVDTLYRSNSTSGQIHPILVDLDDLTGGRGWFGNEFPGLATRLKGLSDVVLALGLVHHLAIAHSIPLPSIVEFLDFCSRRYVIIECIAESDPLVTELCRQRDRQPTDFSMTTQLACLNAVFNVLDTVDIKGTQRRLVLLEKRTAS